MMHSQVEEISLAEVCFFRDDYLMTLLLYHHHHHHHHHYNHALILRVCGLHYWQHYNIHKTSPSFIYLHSCIISLCVCVWAFRIHGKMVKEVCLQTSVNSFPSMFFLNGTF